LLILFDSAAGGMALSSTSNSTRQKRVPKQTFVRIIEDSESDLLNSDFQ